MSQRAWLDKLERSFGEWALPTPSLYLVGMNAAVWVLTLIKPEFPMRLALDPELVMSGEVWRLLTFLFIPPHLSPMWMVFWLLMFYSFANALEGEWGEFKFAVYYAVGAGATVAASAALGTGLSSLPLNTSLFLAFARLFPEVELYLFFVLPVKVRWLAWAAWGVFALNFLLGSWVTRVALLAGVANWAVFFGREALDDLKRLRRP